MDREMVLVALIVASSAMSGFCFGWVAARLWMARLLGRPALTYRVVERTETAPLPPPM